MATTSQLLTATADLIEYGSILTEVGVDEMTQFILDNLSKEIVNEILELQESSMSRHSQSVVRTLQTQLQEY
jgi:hypothetical protein